MWEWVELAESWIEDPEREYVICLEQLRTLRDSNRITPAEWEASVIEAANTLRDAREIQAFRAQLGL